jgi:microsomal dipeptidase-like Zn-dependent dipeptidase
VLNRIVWVLLPLMDADQRGRRLVKHGYSDEDIAKAIGGNAVRLLREVW